MRSSDCAILVAQSADCAVALHDLQIVLVMLHDLQLRWFWCKHVVQSADHEINCCSANSQRELCDLQISQIRDILHTALL